MSMRESFLYDKLPGGKVKCNVCAVRCIIPEGDRGSCRTRLNDKGTLYTLLYGLTSSVCIDPIEKKPLYHFYPGSKILSMGTRGCNFRCPGCQNWEISHDSPDRFGENMERLEPAESARLAKREACQGSAGPTTIRRSGSSTLSSDDRGQAPRPLQRLHDQRLRDRGADGHDRPLPHRVAGRSQGLLAGVVQESHRAREMGRRPRNDEARAARVQMHVECVTNVTPTINDGEETAHGIAGWIRDNLGPLTPWHVTRFVPYLDLSTCLPRRSGASSASARSGARKG